MKDPITILGYYEELTDQAWSFIFDKRQDPWKTEVKRTNQIRLNNKRRYPF